MENLNPADGIDKHAFITENLSNFNCGKGWHELIKSFLSEMIEAGWPVQTQIYGKEKFGKLRISFGNNLNQPMLEIAHKYEAISETVCELCGDAGKHRVINFWEQTLCTNHFLDRYSIINVSAVNFNKVFRVEFEHDYEQLNLYARGFLGLGREELKASFNSPDINYYALLKVIPKLKIEEEDRLYLERFFSGLKGCEICGYKAVHLGVCKYCYNPIWDSNSPSFKHYFNKQSYIKEMQMDWWLDKDDYRKLKDLNETSFEPLPNHKQIFNEDDLKKYIEEQNSNSEN
ncbi:hypothetical protein [Mucilaginibacter pedocola]|uniref:Uncharacterized protein n=1 Tax=Mucilaginibacter pedocola TaxID=1792845 RepID=A0A1S9PET5_9SPHI|nr:hypothetical protein [Mucilaginibacter pedocola]OOQ59456.1 hypothetical protein BC343_04545 [Mucilaginibacter pedocola]